MLLFNRRIANQKPDMPTTITCETLLSTLKRSKPQHTTILVEDPFLSHFAEKSVRTIHNTPFTRHIYSPKTHASIQTSLSSRDMFSDSHAHIIQIKGTDLKHEPLAHLINNPNDVILIYQIEKIQPAQKKTKNFLTLARQTTVISTKALSEKKTLTWMKTLCAFHQIQISDRLIHTVCQRLDGDLSSLDQLVTQLVLQNVKETKTIDDLTPYILTTQQAPIFSTIDAIFNGKYDACVAFFQRHHQADILQKIYWMSLKRLRQMVRLQEKYIAEKASLQTLLQNERIWPQMQPMFRKALQHPQPRLQQHYIELCDLEYLLKGQSRLNFEKNTTARLLKLCQALG